MIRLICMYCDREYGTKESIRDGDSHGICPACDKLSDAERDELALKKIASFKDYFKK